MDKYRKFTSPIEVMLRNAFVKEATARGVRVEDFSVFAGRTRVIVETRESFGVPRRRLSIESAISTAEEWGDDADTCGQLLLLYSDVDVLSYRADFVISTNGGALLSIECDGHEWHERTKQQAAYDKSRDRELLALGVPTLRFTGSEIHSSIDRCVADIYAATRQLEEREDEIELAWKSGWQSGNKCSQGSERVEEHW